MASEPKLPKGQKAYLQRVVNELRSQYDLAYKELKGFYREVMVGGEGKLPIKQKIDNAAADAEVAQRKIETFRAKSLEAYQALVEGDGDTPSLKEQIQQRRDQLDDLLDEIETERTKLTALIKEFMGDEATSTKGHKQRIEEMADKQTTSLAVWNKKHEDLHDKIESLLSGATTVGLATSYHEQKKEYEVPNQRWAAVFVASIVLMGIVAVCYFPENPPTTFEEAMVALATRLPFFGPLIWLGWFASKQQSQNKRLEQEYAHKETLAKSFDGFKKQIEQVKDGDTREKLLSELLAVIVEVAKNNPSETLDNPSHSENPPSIIDRLSFNAQ